MAATPPATDDATTPVATLGAAAAARALGVRRETVYRLWREGKLPYVTERGDDGSERRRVPVAAIEERLGDVGRGPQATTPRTPSATPENVAGHTDAHHIPDVVSAERLLLAERSVSTLRAQLAAERALIESAAARLDEPVKTGWFGRRRAERDRLAEAATALRQLASLPADVDAEATGE